MARASRKKILFIVHGARAELPGIRHLVKWVRDKGHVVDPRVTWERGDAERFAREGVARTVDVVVAVGGDGTVNEVVNGLDGAKVPLGIIPAGTANDFSKQTGIPNDPDHAMDVILRRKPVLIDTAEVNGRRFLNVSTGGVAAEATAETPADAKASLGPLAYAITGLRKLGGSSTRRATFTAPGLDLTCKYLFFAVGNARVTGGGSVVTPRAEVTDGLLDVCVVEARPRRDLARLLLSVRKGEHVGEEGVHYLQVPSVTVSGERPVTVNVDGEPREETRFTYRARPKDLWIYLPWLPGEGEE